MLKVNSRVDVRLKRLQKYKIVEKEGQNAAMNQIEQKNYDSGFNRGFVDISFFLIEGQL